MSDNSESVICPVCKGTGLSPISNSWGCKCCNGLKTISKVKADALSRIRKDISERLQNYSKTL